MRKTGLSEFSGKTVVVTGAAHGLGAEVARSFARRGARLELCDIDGEGLREIRAELEARGAEVSTEVVDVAEESRMKEYRDQVLERSDVVDVLVNNAGVVCAGLFEDVSLKNWRWITGIDFWGVIHGCHFFYPGMKERGSGHIVNIASAAAYAPVPLLTSYSSLKAAVLSFSQNLRAEGALCGVGVSAVCPGVMSTNIASTMRFSSQTERSSSQKFAARVERFMQAPRYSPARVAEAVVRAVERDIGIVNVGIETKCVDLLWRLNRRLAVALSRFSLRIIRHQKAC